MDKITRTTKSNDRFNKMRSVYLGDKNKKHPVTGLLGQRDKNYVSWGYNEKIINEKILPRIMEQYPLGSHLKNVLLINDFTFELTNTIIEKYDVENITVKFVVKDEEDKANIQEWLEDYFAGLEQLNIVYITK